MSILKKVYDACGFQKSGWVNNIGWNVVRISFKKIKINTIHLTIVVIMGFDKKINYKERKKIRKRKIPGWQSFSSPAMLRCISPDITTPHCIPCEWGGTCPSVRWKLACKKEEEDERRGGPQRCANAACCPVCDDFAVFWAPHQISQRKSSRKPKIIMHSASASFLLFHLAHTTSFLCVAKIIN